ncbi:MAG: hypothetical protein Tsb005_20490 [Gammaproteobacteria bacterium]
MKLEEIEAGDIIFYDMGNIINKTGHVMLCISKDEIGPVIIQGSGKRIPPALVASRILPPERYEALNIKTIKIYRPNDKELINAAITEVDAWLSYELPARARLKEGMNSLLATVINNNLAPETLLNNLYSTDNGIKDISHASELLDDIDLNDEIQQKIIQARLDELRKDFDLLRFRLAKFALRPIPVLPDPRENNHGGLNCVSAVALPLQIACLRPWIKKQQSKWVSDKYADPNTFEKNTLPDAYKKYMNHLWQPVASSLLFFDGINQCKDQKRKASRQGWLPTIALWDINANGKIEEFDFANKLPKALRIDVTQCPVPVFEASLKADPEEFQYKGQLDFFKYPEAYYTELETKKMQFDAQVKHAQEKREAAISYYKNISL